MEIKILDKFTYQTFPLDEKVIEVSEKELSEIGKTKCFDVENNTIVDYDNTKDMKIRYNKERIIELKNMLASWDYKTSKYLDGDYTEEEWKEISSQRKLWRAEINKLEEEIKWK